MVTERLTNESVTRESADARNLDILIGWTLDSVVNHAFDRKRPTTPLYMKLY